MEEVQGTGILRRSRTWKSLRDRLALIGCCASPRGSSSHPTTLDAGHGEGGLQGRFRMRTFLRRQQEAAAAEDGMMPASPAMSLAMALAAEREFRAAVEGAEEEDEEEMAETPASRVSLMSLLEEGDDERAESMRGCGDDGGEEWWCCCVCMMRKKGAAFIPCGHTFCRVCCRELWLNRRRCPLCNRAIVDILDIF